MLRLLFISTLLITSCATAGRKNEQTKVASVDDVDWSQVPFNAFNYFFGPSDADRIRMKEEEYWRGQPERLKKIMAEENNIPKEANPSVGYHNDGRRYHKFQ